MQSKSKDALRILLVTLGVVLGLFATLSLFYAFLGPSRWNILFGMVAYSVFLIVAFRCKRGYVLERLFPNSTRSRARTR